MSFRSVFVALVIGFGLVVGRLPRQPAAAAPSRPIQASAGMVRATGKCAECHSTQQYSIVHEYEMSVHAAKGRQLPGMPPARRRTSATHDHHGFVIAKALTAANCRSCHETGLPAVPAQPARRAVVGGGLRRQGALGRAGRVLGEVPPGRVQAAGEPAGRAGGRGGDRQRLRQVPRRRQAERRRHDRHLHRLPHPAHLLGRDRPPADDLRPVPHGAGPLAARDLQRVEARRPVRRPEEPTSTWTPRPRSSPPATCSCRPAPPAT